MKKALVVGIDDYDSFPSLNGCVNDAYAVKNILERNSDGSVNFDIEILTGTVNRDNLKDWVRNLFGSDDETALLYFAGHGHLEMTGGYLVTSECQQADAGLPLTEVLTFANNSEARNKIIVLDSCHSGAAGTPPGPAQAAELTEGLTILAAATANQYAAEIDGKGLFTELFVDALNGAAKNLVGDVTPGAVYAHIDQSLGRWTQRPVFKTNVKNFVSLRKAEPPIPLADLRRIAEFFPTPGFQFQLDPSFEPRSEGRTATMPASDPENNRKFAILQKFNRVNLLVPVDALHMWYAAMESKSCKLTVLGEHYRRLVEAGRI